jgi:hypothetical protein
LGTPEPESPEPDTLDPESPEPDTPEPESPEPAWLGEKVPLHMPDS